MEMKMEKSVYVEQISWDIPLVDPLCQQRFSELRRGRRSGEVLPYADRFTALAAAHHFHHHHRHRHHHYHNHSTIIVIIMTTIIIITSFSPQSPLLSQGKITNCTKMKIKNVTEKARESKWTKNCSKRKQVKRPRVRLLTRNRCKLTRGSFLLSIFPLILSLFSFHHYPLTTTIRWSCKLKNVMTCSSICFKTIAIWLRLTFTQ